MADFSNRFYELRKAHGYTQQGIAEALHVSRSIIGMYETGKRYPAYETMETIADFFNVDMDYLTGRSDTTKDYNQIFTNSNSKEAPADPKAAVFADLVSQLSDEDVNKVLELAKLLLMAERNNDKDERRT